MVEVSRRSLFALGLGAAGAVAGAGGAAKASPVFATGGLAEAAPLLVGEVVCSIDVAAASAASAGYWMAAQVGLLMRDEIRGHELMLQPAALDFFNTDAEAAQHS